MNTILSDVNVTLDVLEPTVPINLGMLAVFVPGVTAGKAEYTSLEDAQAKITDDSVVAVANGFFAQHDHAEKLLVITYTDLDTALTTYANEGWEFATLAGAETPTKDNLTLANYIEGRGKQFAVFAVPATDATVTSAKTLSQQYFSNQRTVIFAVGEDDAAEKYGVGALIGALGNETVGSITWKFKTLNGVKPVNLNGSQISKLHESHIFTYVTKGTKDQTTEGFTVSGEFIDALHGDDWVKASMETDLQNLLSTTDKLTYDTKGIAQIDATMTGVLLTATANGIVLLDDKTGAGQYKVTTLDRAEVSAQDIQARHYAGASFAYTRSSAIHSVTVHGTVSL